MPPAPIWNVQRIADSRSRGVRCAGCGLILCKHSELREMAVCRWRFGVCSLCIAGFLFAFFCFGCLLACFVRVVDLGGCWLLCFRCDVGLLLFAGLLCWLLAVVVCLCCVSLLRMFIAYRYCIFLLHIAVAYLYCISILHLSVPVLLSFVA